MSIQRKDLQRVYKIMDKHNTGRIRLEDLKSVASLVTSKDDELDLAAINHETSGLTGTELIRRQEINDIYD
jgi:Ca2+-binding EF-hand superfamily protein